MSASLDIVERIRELWNEGLSLEEIRDRTGVSLTLVMETVSGIGLMSADGEDLESD